MKLFSTKSNKKLRVLDAKNKRWEITERRDVKYRKNDIYYRINFSMMDK